MWVTKEEYHQMTELNKEQLIAISRGTFIKDQPEDCPRLPAPPMMMIDKVYGVEHKGKRGRIIGEKHLNPDDWFFQCHFLDDPIMPGCLSLDAIWQLIGLYNSLKKVSSGSGRALGCGDVDFFGQIRPHHKIVRYEVDIRRISYVKSTDSTLVVADAKVFVDDKHIYEVKSARIGIFQHLKYREFPYVTDKDHERLNNLSKEAGAQYDEFARSL